MAENENYDRYDDDDDDDDEFDDLTPLVGSDTILHSKPVSPFEIALMRQQQQRLGNDGTSYCPRVISTGNRKVKVFVACMVAGLIGIASLYWMKGTTTTTSPDVPLQPNSNDEMDAAKKQDDDTLDIQPQCDEQLFGLSFSDLRLQIQQANTSSSNELCSEEIMHAYKYDTCKCNTLEPARMVNTKGNPKIGDRWDQIYKDQTNWLNAVDFSVDVAFIGDSITEHWLGTDLGTPIAAFADCWDVFQALFTKKGGGKVEGIIMGIAAERIQNLLYRLRNGVLSNEKIQPKVFWLLIGVNDLGGEFCDVDPVVVGNIAIIEELRKQRPDATIVVNGILPWTKLIDKYSAKVNERLECYANMTEGVLYFDTWEIFRFPTNHSKNSGYYQDGLHPNSLGYRAWGEAALKVIETLIGPF